MAELIAGLDGPVYVERVALFDAKQRDRRRRRRSRRRSQLQVENRGFAFVEVLAECPTHLEHDAATRPSVGARRRCSRSSRSA